MQKNEQGIYDFDAIVIDPKIVKVGGEKADVSMMPVAVSLALAKRSDMSRAEMMAEAKSDGEASLRRTLQMVSDVCVVSNPKMTVDFLMQHLGGPKLTSFVKFVLQPIDDKDEEFEEPSGKGNPKSDETT